MHSELCVCHLFRRLDFPHRFSVLIHYRENWKPSNSGYLAGLAFRKSRVIVRRDPIDYARTPALAAATETPVVLFPSAAAEPLGEFVSRHSPRSRFNFIVPDGSWRQASKMIQRDPFLRSLPRVGMPAGPPTQYRLRTETRPEGMATFEAMAQAVGICGYRELELQLRGAFRAWVIRRLWTRGRILPETDLQQICACSASISKLYANPALQSAATPSCQAPDHATIMDSGESPSRGI